MFFCPICNAKIEDNAKFCPKCGNKINKQIKKEAYEIVTIGLAVFALFLSIIPVSEVIIYISVVLSIGAFGASVYSYIKNKKCSDCTFKFLILYFQYLKDQIFS